MHANHTEFSLKHDRRKQLCSCPLFLHYMVWKLGYEPKSFIFNGNSVAIELQNSTNFHFALTLSGLKKYFGVFPVLLYKGAGLVHWAARVGPAC